MSDQIPPRAILWSLFTATLIIAWVVLGLNGLSGLVPVMFVSAFLIVFHPPKAVITDADIDALLGRS